MRDNIPRPRRLFPVAALLAAACGGAGPVAAPAASPAPTPFPSPSVPSLTVAARCPRSFEGPLGSGAVLGYLSTSTALVPTGRLDVLVLDAASGCLAPLHAYEVTAPQLTVADPSGRFLFVGARRWDIRGADVIAFRVSAADGGLEPIGTVPLKGCCFAPGAMAATDDLLFSLAAAASTGFRSQNVLFGISARTGALTALGPFTTAWEPVYVEVEPGHRFVYVQGQEVGGVTRLVHTLRIGASGATAEIDRTAVPRPCASAMDRRGDFLWMGCMAYDIRGANGVPAPIEPFDSGTELVPHPTLDVLYRVGAGRIDAFAIDRASGHSTLAFSADGPNTPLTAAIDPLGRFLFVSGRTDRGPETFAFALDAQGAPRGLGAVLQGGPHLTLLALP